MSVATARARANFALIKYWGKRDAALNLPAAGSLSLTVDALHTTTTVEWTDGVADAVVIDGDEKTGGDKRVSAFLDLLRGGNPELGGARVVSESNFPAAAGLASSASAFAALAAAASSAAGLAMEPEALSRLARRGSGSASRSIFGGFAVWEAGERADGEDSFARSVRANGGWDLRLTVLQVDAGAKEVSSRDGMNHTSETSPYFAPWVAETSADLARAEQAVAAADFAQLGRLAERSCFMMHACAMGADPAVIYFKPATLALINKVHKLRREGLPVYVTVDAGPHVKVISMPGDQPTLIAEAEAWDEAAAVTACRPGAGFELLDEHLS